MKFKRRMVPKPKLKMTNILALLKKEPISYDKFLDLIDEAADTFFDTPELEFELLLSNGLPLELDEDNNVYLKTIKTKIQEQCFCIVDIETNGASVKKGCQIIELGAVKYRNGEIIDTFDSLVYAKEIPEFIQEITNITPDMLVDAPVIQNVLKDFKKFLDDDVFVAHPIKFDYGYISDSFEKYDLGKLQNRKICTIDLARRTIQSEKYGLSSLKETLNIDVDNHHRAYYDALTTKHVFEESLKNIDYSKIKTVEELIDFSKNAKVLNPNIKKKDEKKISNKEDEN
ncbi:3'-5' exonuclease [Poseidonibacter sp.]|uniref:3'-5' exonuclease n=1 Tax=Poseidonibacter sp. TaxID=2321188 RepID=UPI003C76B1AD